MSAMNSTTALTSGRTCLLVPDAGESELEWSGKAGVSGGPLYAEVSFITGEETSVGFKTGAKFKF